MKGGYGFVFQPAARDRFAWRRPNARRRHEETQIGNAVSLLHTRRVMRAGQVSGWKNRRGVVRCNVGSIAESSCRVRQSGPSYVRPTTPARSLRVSAERRPSLTDTVEM
jgi:hypothetical protein